MLKITCSPTTIASSAYSLLDSVLVVFHNFSVEDLQWIMGGDVGQDIPIPQDKGCE
ncbi:hypothetical protein L798_01098 [Zootermopsis nevadensis]|uniref:Uncharacterized protein n=1 Tax=Zootermopsis nevadensis TaxID=136037 RepID=A0A067QK08_ZOONE|nr:hypothetical protein L798_01098 [Zootermopsis nevadensis]